MKVCGRRKTDSQVSKLLGNVKIRPRQLIWTKMAGTFWIYLVLVSSAWICIASALQTSVATSQIIPSKCSDAEDVYLKRDWSTFISCCELLYPNETCPLACPCRNGADCFPNNRTCICKPGWVGTMCQQSCREKSNNTYGLGCKRGCRCGPDAGCEPMTGVCECVDPKNCTERCPRNRYGPKCRKKCRCKTGGCDHVTGACHIADGSQVNCGCENGGNCRRDGKPCRCTAGWTGRLCDAPCPSGFYGEDCSIPCGCGGNSTCSRSTGLCKCAAENRYSCAGRCPDGFYGPRCSYTCNCPDSMTCNQWTGDCECLDSNDCGDIINGRTTDSGTNATTAHFSTASTPLATNVTTGMTLWVSSSPRLHTRRENATTETEATTRQPAESSGPAAVDRGPTDSAAGGSPQLRDNGTGGSGFSPSAPFWGVVGAIAVLLVVVVILLLLILRRQMSTSRSALTHQPKIGRQDNAYETVEEIGKGAPTDTENITTPPPLPEMFSRRGGTRSSVQGYRHRPLSVHSPLPAMDAPLPASVAAMVCGYGNAPPEPGGTSRRSLMAEWRPHGVRPGSLAETRAKSRSQTSLHEDPIPDRAVKALSLYNGGITIEDDYSDPFDTISPKGDTGNRPPGYLPMLLGQDRGRQSPIQRSESPTPSQQRSSPMTVQRSDSPMTMQRSDSPSTLERSSSPMNIQRSGSPLTVHQRDLNRNHLQSDTNMNNHPNSSPMGLRRGVVSSPSLSSMSPQRQSGSPDTDPFYFTLEQDGSPARSSPGPGIYGPEDDYDELEPQPAINSPSTGALPANNRSASRTSSEHSRPSSRASSRGSLTANSPTLSSSLGTSPGDVEMFGVLDRGTETARPNLPQRPLSSNVYESCRPRTTPVNLADEEGIYSKLNRTPSQWSQLAMSQQGLPASDPDNIYGRLQRSYSAKSSGRYPGSDLADGPQGRLPQRSRSAITRGHQMSGSADCVAGEWVPAEPGPRLPPRSAKSPLVTEPRKKFRWSIKGKKQLTKKSSKEELDVGSPPTSTATLPYPGDWKGL